uniref:Uncharacterized protein n=1 Tax=Vespula pensylvanica TaxID=30213 RepID=A0A834P7V9_VESPE|nr:hypothetical protein H0235_004648 [Vespula pensylvanica]
MPRRYLAGPSANEDSRPLHSTIRNFPPFSTDFTATVYFIVSSTSKSSHTEGSVGNRRGSRKRSGPDSNRSKRVTDRSGWRN